jgi:hypothetical protein
MAVYLLVGVILLMAPFAGVGVSHIFIDLVNRLKLNGVSAGIKLRKRDELDTEQLLRELVSSLRLLHTRRSRTRSIERKRNVSDDNLLD